MLQEGNNNVNNEQQSDDLLKQEKKKKDNEEITFWKRPVLFVLCLGGLYAISLLVHFLVLGLPKWDRSGANTLITYSIIFVLMCAVVSTDAPKLLKKFKAWKPYVFAAAFAGGMLIFNALYSRIINLFYPMSEQTSGNEEAVRSVIDIYPIASLFIIGFIGPMCEELAYRVGLFGMLKRVHRVLAYAVTGLIFGLIHFDYFSADIVREFVYLPTYIVPGIILSVAYDLFGLPCSFVAHSMNNVLAVLLTIMRSFFE